MNNVEQFKPKPQDNEKITINLGSVDLGRIDLLVQEGVYANHSDLIRTAIRNENENHGDVAQMSFHPERAPPETEFRRCVRNLGGQVRSFG